jgi:lysophospholipase L1-like esterase
MNADRQLTYLALGDSYTIGESVEVDQRWPMQLAAELRTHGIDLTDPVIIARTGWTTADLQAAIERLYKGEQYDLVSLLIGVNNQYQGLSIDTFRQQFRELVAFAISAAGYDAARVIVLSIPDWGFTPFADRVDAGNVSAEIDAFNMVVREESEAAGVHYFDITPLTRPRAFDPELFAEDGLHPSAKMYGMWVEQILPSVMSAIETR